MVLDIITGGGIGRDAEQFQLFAAEVVIRDMQGNIIGLACAFGPNDAIQLLRLGDPGFGRALADRNLAAPAVVSVPTTSRAGLRLVQSPS